MTAYADAVLMRDAWNECCIPVCNRALFCILRQHVDACLNPLLQKKSRTDKSAKEVDPSQPAFTRRREVFAGRLAMFGFAASLIGEVSQSSLACFWNEVLPCTACWCSYCRLFVGSTCILLSSSSHALYIAHQPSPVCWVRLWNLYCCNFASASEAWLCWIGSCVMQVASGKGVLGQLSLETGLSTNFIEIALVALIGYNLFSVCDQLMCSEQ